MRWKLPDGKPGRYGALLPPNAILLEDGSRVVGEARDEEEARSIVQAHNASFESSSQGGG